METYTIGTQKYAARSMSQALLAHRKFMQHHEVKPRPMTTEEIARRARTQPHYQESK